MAPPRSGLRPFDPRLLRRTTDVRFVLALDCVVGLVAAVLLLAQMTLLAGGIAGAAQGRAIPAGSLAALVGVIGIRAVIIPFVERTGRGAANRVMSRLRRELVATYLGPGRPTDADPGDLATAAVQGVDGLETYFARYLPQVVLAATVPIAVLGWTAWVDPVSASIMAVTLPVIPIFLVLIGRSAARRSRANWQAMVALSAHFLDVVSGLPTLRAFNRGQAQVPKIAAAAEQYRRTTMGTLRLAFLSGVVLDLATTLSIALVAVTLGVRLVGGGVALGPALTVLLLVPEMYAPIRAVGTLFHSSADGLAGAERILTLVDRPLATPASEPQAACGPVDRTVSIPDPRHATLHLDAVTVRHPGGSHPSLDALTLTIEPGELVVVTGPSGVGKTTLGRVLVGLDRPTSGRVLVGHHELVKSDLDEWRHHVAWAPQRPTVLHASVADNIALGRPAATAAEIEAAATAAGAHEFIERLPSGYATVLGPGGRGGRGLSVGERQRIGLARALLRRAPLLVIDEPTAHLDDASVAVVRETLERTAGTATVVLITHDRRLAGVAQHSVELVDGRRPAVEVGT